MARHMEATMKRLERIMQCLMLVLFAGFVLPVSIHSQERESRTATANGHGKIISAVDEREITSALIFFRANGTFLLALSADIQLQAEGTWKASTSSPGEILLKITGGVLEGEMTGSGKVLLTSDRVSIKKLTANVKTVDGREIAVTFVADASE
jgi:hypothetical protein